MEYSNIEDLVKELAPVTGEPAKVYSAVVSRIDQDGRVWVHVAGSDIETPTATTSAEVSPNDAVNVEWRNNKLYIAGNVTNPAAGSTRVNAVEQAAQIANQAAQSAVSDAGVARQAAESAQHAVAEIEDDVTGLNARLTTAEGNITTIEGNITSLGTRVATAEGNITTIEGDIDDIESDVSGLSSRVVTAEGKVTTLEGNVTNLQGRVTTAEGDITAVEGDITTLQGRVSDAEETVDGTLRELSVAQDVIGTINWIANHGTMTDQTGHQFDENQVYFIVDANGDYNVGGTRYSVVSEPVASDINNYYLLTISDSVQNYVATHVVVDSEGLWIIPDAGGNKVLIATGQGSTYTSAGTYVISGSVILARFTTNDATIGDPNGAHTTIDNDGMQISVLDVSRLKVLANIGYGLGRSESGSIVDAPYFSFGERQSGSVIGNYSMAEGYWNEASGYCSHVEGEWSFATNKCAHAEGRATASGEYSHAEGVSTASGTRSHAEGGSSANGDYSHAQNATTAGYDYQTTIGKHNDNQSNNAFEIGNGNGISGDPQRRSNAFEVDWSGNVTASGDITDGSGNVLSDKADTSIVPTMSAILDMFYPVGTYYETSLSEQDFNPNTAWGGTWVLDSKGRVTVSQDTNDTAFDVLGETGGEKTHTLTKNEMPAHNHDITFYYRNTVAYNSGSAARPYSKSGSSSTQNWADSSTEGGGHAHNNLQPYIVVNRWHRTA